MKSLQKAVLLLTLSLILAPIYGQEKQIIGYYPSWKWQTNREALDPQAIPYDKLTILTYAFFYPVGNGKIVGMNPVADRALLEGKVESVSGDGQPNDSIVDLAHRQGAKVVLSIGGWENSNFFPEVAGDLYKTINFARWCVRYMKEYDFDGIDVDWEFPGYAPHNGTPYDKHNFTALLETVRDSLDALGKRTGKDYLLSASLPAAASHLEDIEVEKVTNIVDHINIMTYDLFGPWGEISNHNSALYAPAQGDSARCVDGAFRLYHEQHGVPAEKINLGAAFYGHAYSNCTQIYSEHSGADTTIFHEDGGVNYTQIVDHLDPFKRFWDEKAQVPYLVSERHQVLVSFDDEKSIALKADYVLQNNARGLIIWPLMGDYVKDGQTPLLDVIHKVFASE